MICLNELLCELNNQGVWVRIMSLSDCPKLLLVVVIMPIFSLSSDKLRIIVMLLISQDLLLLLHGAQLFLSPERNNLNTGMIDCLHTKLLHC